MANLEDVERPARYSAERAIKVLLKFSLYPTTYDPEPSELFLTFMLLGCWETMSKEDTAMPICRTGSQNRFSNHGEQLCCRQPSLSWSRINIREHLRPTMPGDAHTRSFVSTSFAFRTETQRSWYRVKPLMDTVSSSVTGTGRGTYTHAKT